MPESAYNAIELEETLKATKEKRKALWHSLRSKCDDLDNYAKYLCEHAPPEEGQEDETGYSNGYKMREKSTILSNLAFAVRQVLEQTNPDSYDVGLLKQQIRLAYHTVINNETFNTIAEHRHPVLRWIKEIMAMIGTAIVGTLVKTGFNVREAYNAPHDFSWSDVSFGFFANTASVNRTMALISTATALDNLDPVNEAYYQRAIN